MSKTEYHNKHIGRKPRVLFVLRKRDDYWGQLNPSSYNSSGLLNSATFIKDMLVGENYEAKLVQITDSNLIDKEVFDYNPDVVIIEAIWCPPAKLKELTKLNHHKHRKWFIRNHSEFPFLAFEGIALEWILEYATIPGVTVSCNSPTANEELQKLFHIRHGNNVNVSLLTNYYPIKHRRKIKDHDKTTLDVGCFGAIRPLKNNLEQAIASIIFANSIGKKLRFHINSSRVEGNAHSVLKSIRALFKNSPNAQLIEEPWMDRKEFLELCAEMDIGLQVSYSETFNIVAADLISRSVPVVCSDEIPWIPEKFQADPSSAIDISNKMSHALKSDTKNEFESLVAYSESSKILWENTLNE